MNVDKNRAGILDIAKSSICIALLSVASYVVMPLPFTPVVLSMHTVAVNIIGLIMRPKNAAYTIAVYIVMGLLGLPVFSVGTGGAAKLFGPTGGFYFGFLFAVIAISLLKGRQISFKRYLLVTAGVGMPVQYLSGMLFIFFYNDFNIRAAAASVVPFIPGDVVRCIIASVVAVALNRADNKCN